MNSLFNENVCPGAGPTANYRHIFEVQYTMSNVKLGYYNICKNCGESAGEVLEPAYQDQVSKLPAQGYTSDGGLVFPFEVISHGIGSGTNQLSGCDGHIRGSSSYSSYVVYYHCDTNSIAIQLQSGYSSFRDSRSSIFNYSITFPYDGYYSFIVPSPILSYVTPSGERGTRTGTVTRSSTVYYKAGATYSLSRLYVSLPSDVDLFSATATMEIPVAKFTPAPSVDPDYQSQYGTDTRPTVITGVYGIVDNQGVATVIKDCTIVNETTNNYYNPATGQNYPIKDRSYDYPSREYTITTDSNNTVTITYGDENVTIQEGDTIYNIYYVVDGIGEEKPPCAHDWQAETKTDPTCVQPGRQPYACSKCGETKSDTIPALGHDWQVKQSVNTQYDDTGQLVQEGYTIYECTRCGEQNRTTSGAGPPPSGGGDAPGGEEDASIWDKLGDLLGTLITGISGLLGSVLGKLLEALTSLSQLILDGLGSVVETVLSLFDSVPQLFGGFLAFLSAVFPFLPEEMVTLLTFGLAAVVFIGILKAVRK